MNILITGGAGFIGSHLADRLIDAGARVRILDNLDPQVHGQGRCAPAYLNDEADLIIGDIRDPRAVRQAIDSVDAVFHFAARVGVGQSMYEMADYTSVNNLGTATLLEALADSPAPRLQRLVVASSMSLYGEGRYIAPDGRIVDPPQRRREQLEQRQWELSTGMPGCARRGEPLRPIPTPESKPPAMASVYALSKYDQERLCLMFGRAYGVPTVALRFFNVYGPRQALHNPYTGVLAIFASTLLSGRDPVIFEDGMQRRDFVSVHDIVSACMLALESRQAPGHALNIGSGQSTTVMEVARQLDIAMNAITCTSDTGNGRMRTPCARTASGKFRTGDVRHCFADISLARELLGYEPQVDFEDGLAEFASWLQTQQAIDQQINEAMHELSCRGLIV